MARKQKTPKPVIKAASIATAIDKVTGKVLGWAVKSNSTQDFYQVQTMAFENGAREFFCNCEAHLWGCAECCHIKAVKEVLAAKAELAQEEAAPEQGVLSQPACNHWKKHTHDGQYGPNKSCYWCANPPLGPTPGFWEAKRQQLKQLAS
jgi:hypothetical protein